MTSEEVEQTFEEVSREYLHKDRVTQPRHPRNDIAAFLLLHEIVGGTGDIVRAAEHDMIYLDCTSAKLAQANVTRDQIIELRRYGVSCGDGTLYMFV